MDNTRLRLMDTPTNINPVSVAEALTIAEKKLDHSFIAG
jgi:hypothetical protein